MKESATFKLLVPKKVEEKIRYLCRKFPSLEWSGILFYTHTGNFEDNNLEIHCEDIYPMDLGSATFTTFKNDETIASYIADNIELFNCDMGLVHSHNQMSCFFSGTDTATLQSEGNDTNCFVSLIVNNAGTYCAAITRKIQRKTEVVTKSLGTSYEFFGDGEIRTDEDPMSECTQIIDREIIEYFMLDVEREIVDNPFDFLDRRFEEITARKNTTSSYTQKERDDEFYDWIHSSKNEVKELPVFDKKTMDEMVDYESWYPDPTIIHRLACQMITCSLIISKDVDLKQWITKHMLKVYSNIFDKKDSLGQFKEYSEFIVEFLITQYEQMSEESIPEELLVYLDIYQQKIAEALLDELGQYPTNGYIDAYKEILMRYCDEQLR